MCHWKIYSKGGIGRKWKFIKENDLSPSYRADRKKERQNLPVWKLSKESEAIGNERKGKVAMEKSMRFVDLLDKVGKEKEWDKIPDFGAGENVQFSSVQFNCSVVSSSLWPMGCIMPGFTVHHQLPEATEIHVHHISDAIQPSHPL